MSTPKSLRAWPAVLACLAALGGCGTETDTAVAPLPVAFEALGLHRLTYAKVQKQGDTLSLIDVRAETEAHGEVRASEVSVKGFKGVGSAWSAERVTADRLSGAVSADRAVILEPHATKESGFWVLSQSGVYADGGVAGHVLGNGAQARRVASAPSPNPATPGTAHEADGIRFVDAGAPVEGTWDIRAATRGDAANLSLVVSKAEGPAGSVTGNLMLDASGARTQHHLGFDLSDLASPNRWPEGYALRKLEATVLLRTLPAWMPGPGTAADPYVASVVAAVAKAFEPGKPQGSTGYAMNVTMSPPRPVPVRDVPRLLADKDATALLGLRFSGEGLPRQPPAPPRPSPFTTETGTGAGTVPQPPSR